MSNLSGHALRSQSKYLCLVKTFGTLIIYLVPLRTACVHIAILVFSDAGRSTYHGSTVVFRWITSWTFCIRLYLFNTKLDVQPRGKCSFPIVLQIVNCIVV